MTTRSYKVVMIGECGVGKSSLYLRFRDNKFVEILRSTVGMDNCKRLATYIASDGQESEAQVCNFSLVIRF